MSEKSFEERIADEINRQLSNGMVEKIVAEKLEKGIKNVMEEFFGWRGEGHNIIKNKIGEIFVPALESYDFSKYITKLDAVLTEIVNNTALTDNKTILSNFRGLMTEPEKDTVKLSDIFKKYCEFVADEVDTDELEIVCEDNVSYVDVRASIVVAPDDSYFPSNKKRILNFSCDEDEKLNYKVYLRESYVNEGEWFIGGIDECIDIRSLKNLNEFRILLMNLERGFINIELDIDEDWESVEPNAEPEVTYS